MQTLTANKNLGACQAIIGLEVHIELATKSKMFCSCPSEHFGVEPNTHTCPICLGLPGALPYPNQKAIEWTILVGLALNCEVSLFSKFDRKNYFYPDLPKGYQISQYDLPLAKNGKCPAERDPAPQESMVNGQCRIRRVHLEEDTGKLIHQGGDSFIDFNRSGVPLLEIVTEPDFSSSEEVKVFLQELQKLVRYLGVAEADMEKGEMRCEPNVNLKITEGDRTYFTPIVEIKNVNSFRFVAGAIDFEIKRQLEEFEKTRIERGVGNKQTRGWDEVKKITFTQREKEEAEDYRYFPEPDIPPLRWTKSQIASLQSQIPELPGLKLARFAKEYGLSESAALILTQTPQTANFYEKAVKKTLSEGISAKEIANLIINKRIKADTKVSVDEFVELVLASKEKAQLPKKEEERLILEAIEKNPSAVDDFKKGKKTALEFLVGQIARLSQGKADPNKIRKLLLDALNAS